MTSIGSEAAMPNPALDSFSPVIGEWRTEGKHPMVPGTTFHGRALFQFIENGAFLMMRTEIDEPEIPCGIAIIGSDDTAGTFFMLYFDERGVSRKYDVKLDRDQLEWRRDDPEFSQLFTVAIGRDKMHGLGRMRRKDGDWEDDLSLTYTR
jgi:hypothetical protein